MLQTFKRAFSGKSSLSTRVVRGASWILFAYLFELALRLGSSLIVTRLLVPEAFGLAAAAGASLSVMVMLSDMGIRSVVITSPNAEDPAFLRTAWSLQIARGMLLFTAALALAAALRFIQLGEWIPATSTFADPLLPKITAVLGVALLLAGFESTYRHLQIRRIDLRALVYLDIASRCAGAATSILWAYNRATVWALVGGSLAGSFMRLILSHTIIRGERMKPAWDARYVREILSRGKWIASHSTLTVLASSADRLLIGVLFPSHVLGIYSIAFQLVESVQSIIRRVHGTVALPMFGELLLKGKQQMIEGLYRYRRPIDIFSFLIAGFLAGAGGAIVSTLYDDRYLEAGWMLSVLALSIAVQPFALVADAFSAERRFKRMAFLKLIRTVSMFAGLAAGFWLAGLLGIVFATALHRIGEIAVTMGMAGRRGWIRWRREFQYLPLILIGAAGGIGLTFAKDSVVSLWSAL